MVLLPRRLSARINLAVACILLSTGMALGWMTASDQSASLLADMRANSTVMVRNFAESTARYLLVEDYAELEGFLVKSAELPDIERIQLCEPDGRLIWDVERVGNTPPHARTRIARIVPPSPANASAAVEEHRLVIWQPVGAGNLLGWLRAEYSLASIEEARDRTWRRTFLLVVVWVACSVVLIVLVLRPIVDAIGRLTSFAKQLDERKGDQIVVGDSSLEIAELGASLNEASRKLQVTEGQIRQLNRELESRVAERTAQLEVANKELEAFAYSVSHDLRAPLRHIDGFVHLLGDSIEGSLDDDSRHFMDTIRKSVGNMEALIDDLLSFSRMGRGEMNEAQVDLGALTREVIRELEPETLDRNVAWNILDLPTGQGDRAMLRVVMVNLLSNALKFTRKLSRAEIEIGAAAESGGEIVIHVRDNGAGFDMKHADKLFGVFQRLHHADDFEGTGIGLANVRRVIARHGGRTWAEGKVDGGATFYFSLPVKPAV
jgi:signal transduction histidine kinase